MIKTIKMVILSTCFMVVCAAPCFAGQVKQLETELTALHWELNFCNQRMMVIQTQSIAIQTEIKRLQAQAKAEGKEIEEKK